MKLTELFVIYHPYCNTIGETVFKSKIIAEKECAKEIENFKTARRKT